MKYSSEKRAGSGPWPQTWNRAFKAIVQTMRTDRAGDKQPAKRQIFLSSRKRADQCIDDIKARRIFSYERHGFAREKQSSQSEVPRGAMSCWKGFRKTEVFDGVPGGPPLLGQLHVNTGCP